MKPLPTILGLVIRIVASSILKHGGMGTGGDRLSSAQPGAEPRPRVCRSACLLDAFLLLSPHLACSEKKFRVSVAAILRLLAIYSTPKLLETPLLAPLLGTRFRPGATLLCVGAEGRGRGLWPSHKDGKRCRPSGEGRGRGAPGKSPHTSSPCPAVAACMPLLYELGVLVGSGRVPPSPHVRPPHSPTQCFSPRKQLGARSQQAPFTHHHSHTAHGSLMLLGCWMDAVQMMH